MAHDHSVQQTLTEPVPGSVCGARGRADPHQGEALGWERRDAHSLPLFLPTSAVGEAQLKGTMALVG